MVVVVAVVMVVVMVMVVVVVVVVGGTGARGSAQYYTILYCVGWLIRFDTQSNVSQHGGGGGGGGAGGELHDGV